MLTSFALGHLWGTKQINFVKTRLAKTKRKIRQLIEKQKKNE